MEFRPIFSWEDEFSPLRDREHVIRDMGLDLRARKKLERARDGEIMQSFCHQLWDRPQINWDGRLLGCCCNHWGDFGGNAFTDGLAAAINNEPMRYARAMLAGTQPPRPDIPCTTCVNYLGMQRDRKWIRRGWRFRLRRVARALYYALRVRRTRRR